MILTSLVEHLSDSRRIKASEKKASAVHEIRYELLQSECWFDDQYEYDYAPDDVVENVDGNWMDDLDIAA